MAKSKAVPKATATPKAKNMLKKLARAEAGMARESGGINPILNRTDTMGWATHAQVDAGEYTPTDVEFARFDTTTYYATVIKELGWVRAAGVVRNLASACSGSGIFERTCTCLLGKPYRRIVMASEVDESIAVFYQRHCDGCEEFFTDSSVGAKGPGAEGKCYIHNRVCRVPVDQQDIFGASFVCKPYAAPNVHRFNGEDVFANVKVDPDVMTFRDCVRHIRSHAPNYSILECTAGLKKVTQKEGCQASAPINHIMDHAEDGLKAIPKSTAGQIDITGYDVAFPLLGERCFFIIVHERTGQTADGVIEIAKSVLRAVKRLHEDRKFHFSTFLSNAEDAALKDYFRAGTRQGQGAEEELQFDADLAKETASVYDMAVAVGVLQRGAKMPPIHERESKKLRFSTATAREAAVGDIMHIAAAHNTPEADYLLADISQTIGRGMVAHGGAFIRPTTKSKLLCMHTAPALALPREVTPQEIMASMGYPRQNLNMSFLSKSKARTIAGNTIVAPQMGVIILAVLRAMREYRVGGGGVAD
jgi:hypothetical protein